MKGERTIDCIPFRFAGMFCRKPEWDVEQWKQSDTNRKWWICYACNAELKNTYSTSGALLRRNYPYMSVFKYSKGHKKGLSRFRILCRECAYAYGKGVTEIDGETYMEKEDFKG